MQEIEIYRTEEGGYHPFLIREGWQVAQLNSDQNQEIDNIDKLEVHHHTDEVFVLLKGKAVLITGTYNSDEVTISSMLMEKARVYNIPAGTWHNIAMQENCEVLIIEKSDTHLNDCTYKSLSLDQKQNLYKKVKKLYLK